MKRTLWISSILLLASCGAAKVGTNPTPLQDTEHVVLLDRTDKSSLKLVKSKIEKLPSGQMQVTMEMENRNNDNIWTDIQVIFRGADGYEIEKTNWAPFLFEHHEVSTFSTTSLSANPVDYRIIIRKPN